MIAIRTPLRICLLLFAMLWSSLAVAQTRDPTPLQFSDSSEETRFHQLTAELRCVKCQNQSLADSDAQIAHDLRREVLDLMHQGKSDAEVKQHLVQRYGAFVLYKPEVSPGTWLLWFGPLLLVLVGGFVVLRIVKKRGGPSVVESDDNQEW